MIGESHGFTNILNYKWIDLTFTLTYSLGGYSFDKLGTYIENGAVLYGIDSALAASVVSSRL